MPIRKQETKTQKCTKCLTELSIDSFWKSGRKRKDGSECYRSVCKKCHTDQTTSCVRKATLSSFGLNEDLYNKERKKQNYKCLICKKHEKAERWGKLNIDHDHATGKYRGLLCSTCNKGLGLFFDDVNLLKKAIEYLDENST